jgi:hypothetical protein
LTKYLNVTRIATRGRARLHQFCPDFSDKVLQKMCESELLLREQ